MSQMPLPARRPLPPRRPAKRPDALGGAPARDRKSTRLNSSHSQNSYAVFSLKKKTAGRTRQDHSFVYPHDLRDGKDAAQAIDMLRRLLSKEKDGAVLIGHVVYSTSHARLIES